MQLKGLNLLPLPQSDDLPPPTCGVIIEKNGDEERVCNEPATQMVTLVDPDDQTNILAVVLVCDKHDQDLNDGKSLIVAAENGERIGVSYKTKEE